ncbi:hypothetical protein [Mesorhizobium sp.]|uniref:hypothetical protein n=1 Tax=Mesorhizobium sp. TaxID=1871066 RepID=UPI0025C01CE8|nr:hypothetical protein [Mesorhizobium sp.]
MTKAFAALLGSELLLFCCSACIRLHGCHGNDGPFWPIHMKAFSASDSVFGLD